MQNKQDYPLDFDMRKAMELSGTKAGRQLLSILQTQAGPEFRQLIEQASSGDYQAAKSTLASLMELPEVRRLIIEMGGDLNG